MATATIVPVAAAAQAADKIGQAAVKAVTNPIYRRKTTERWDEERQEWVPESREKELNATPAGLLVGAIAAIGGLAVLQRGIRTGTIHKVPADSYWTVSVNGKRELKRYKTYEAARARSDELAAKGGVIAIEEHARERFAYRTRESIADYQPFARGL